MTIPTELVEEVVRIYGYDKIKEELLTGDVEAETKAQDNLRNLCPCPEPDPSSPCPHTPLPEDPS